MIKKNLFSILVALLLLYLSLTNFQKFQSLSLARINNIDKLVHFGMYFIMMSVIIIEHRNDIKKFTTLLIVSLIPLLYGIMIEIIQFAFTSTRSGDVFDAIFDALGILASMIIWIFIRPKPEKSVR